MKKKAVFGIVLLCLCCCSYKSDKVKRLMENGVEIVMNPLDPVKSKDEPSNLSLQEELVISTERDEIAKVGLTDMQTFDVDSGGDVYIIRWRSDSDYIFKFDSKGNFLKSFCRRGQGPGELEWGGMVKILQNGEIMARDPGATKFLVFDKDGYWLQDHQLGSHRYPEFEIDEGKWTISWQDQETASLYNHYGLTYSNFENTKELEGFRWANPLVGNKIAAFGHPTIFTASRENVFIGQADKGYEIHVYTAEGKLRRTIIKKYRPLKVPGEIKQRYAKPQSNPAVEARRKKIAFPDFMPPFRYAFTDDEDRLYVMTYEKSKSPREYMYDVFDSEGIFITRMSLGNCGERPPYGREEVLDASVKNGRLYYIREKTNGFRELVVCRMNWR